MLKFRPRIHKARTPPIAASGTETKIRVAILSVGGSVGDNADLIVATLKANGITRAHNPSSNANESPVGT